MAVFAVALMATAGLLVYSGDDRVIESAPVRDRATDGTAGVVRARGRGLAPRSGSLAAATDTPAPTVALLAIRDRAEEEVRERIGDDETESPDGDNVIDEVVDLVEDGSSIEDAVDEVLGDRNELAPSTPLHPLP